MAWAAVRGQKLARRLIRKLCSRTAFPSVQYSFTASFTVSFVPKTFNFAIQGRLLTQSNEWANILQDCVGFNVGKHEKLPLAKTGLGETRTCRFTSGGAGDKRRVCFYLGLA